MGRASRPSGDRPHEARSHPFALRRPAGDQVDRAVIDLNQFDFDQVKADTDPMLLPGGLKYGGILGFVPLRSGRATLLCNARGRGSAAALERVKRAAQVTVESRGRDTE